MATYTQPPGLGAVSWGDRRLDAITTADVERWRAKLLRDGSSRRTVNKLTTMLGGIFVRARRAYG